MRSTILAALLVLPALTACAPDGPAAFARQDDGVSEESATTVVVEIDRSRFSERELVVAAGTTVRFVNLEAPAHTVTSRDDGPMSFESGELLRGDTFEITFDEPGEYAYFCRIHPTMRGAVIVR